MERTPTNEQIETEVDEHMRQLTAVTEEDLRKGYRELLVLNAMLRRNYMESISLMKVIYVGPKSYFDKPVHSAP